MSLHEAALALATQGWKIFPANFENGAKKSYKSKQYSNGENWGATRDPAQVEQDFTKWPDAGIGIPTGPDNNIWVVEADTPKGHDIDGIANLKTLEDEHGALPPTLTAISPTGSTHYYFRWPSLSEDETIPNSAGQLAPGVDVRGAGGMVIAPPTLRPGKGEYQWKENLLIADAPPWLLQKVIKNKSQKPESSGVAPALGCFNIDEVREWIDRKIPGWKEDPKSPWNDQGEWIFFGKALKLHFPGDDGLTLLMRVTHSGHGTIVDRWWNEKDFTPVYFEGARTLHFYLDQDINWMFRGVLDDLKDKTWVPPSKGDVESQSGAALPLTFFDESEEIALDWIFKNFLAADFNVSTFGAPGSRKTTFLSDIGIHAAQGRNWRGFKCKRKVGVVYFAFERARQVKRLRNAYRIRDGLTGLPFAICDRLIDLLDGGCVDTILTTIAEAEAKMGCPVGLVIFDTWNKGIAAGAGDEDKAKDQNRIAANMRILQQRHGRLCVIGVGHSGKDETRGERGSNARRGDIDVEVQITGDALIKTATVTKANEIAEGDLTSFTFETIQLGQDEDGDPITTSIVSRQEVTPTKGVGKLSEKQELAMRALARVCAERGCTVTVAPGVQIQAASVDDWREELLASGVIDREGANPRARFSELKTTLASKQLISERDGNVWVSTPPIPERGSLYERTPL